MRRILPPIGLFLLLLLVATGFTARVLPGEVPADAAHAQALGISGDDDRPIFYAVRRAATIFTAPDSGKAYVHLGFREPVQLVSEGPDGWSLVRTSDGAQGYVASDAISNVWIRVSKRQAMVYLYRGTDLLFKAPADFGYNAFADKEKRGSLTEPDHWRTPDGVFFVAGKNPRSKFYKALVLNYPTAEDAERGLRQQLISRGEYDAIVRAERQFQMPPMNTALGGWIEIHGKGTGVGSNWTQGCVAVKDHHLDRLWQHVEVGTPVLIE